MVDEQFEATLFEKVGNGVHIIIDQLFELFQQQWRGNSRCRRFSELQ